MFLLPMGADGCFSWHHLVHHDHLRPTVRRWLPHPSTASSQEPATRLGGGRRVQSRASKQADQGSRWGYQAALKRELDPLLIHKGMSKSFSMSVSLLHPLCNLRMVRMSFSLVPS